MNLFPIRFCAPKFKIFLLFPPLAGAGTHKRIGSKFIDYYQNAIDGAFLSLEEKLQLRESIRKKYKRSMEDEHER